LIFLPYYYFTKSFMVRKKEKGGWNYGKRKVGRGKRKKKRGENRLGKVSFQGSLLVRKMRGEKRKKLWGGGN